MIPLILTLGGAALIAAGLKKQCSRCQSYLTLNEKCLSCQQEVCGECGVDVPALSYKGWPLLPEGRCCKVHNAEINAKIDQMKRGLDNEEKVKTWSKNFKGKTPSPRLRKMIETSFHANRDDAERELRIKAAISDCYEVTELAFEQRAASYGNYDYSEWKATGLV